MKYDIRNICKESSLILAEAWVQRASKWAEKGSGASEEVPEAWRDAGRLAQTHLRAVSSWQKEQSGIQRDGAVTKSARGPGSGPFPLC